MKPEIFDNYKSSSFLLPMKVNNVQIIENYKQMRNRDLVILIKSDNYLVGKKIL